MDETLDNSPVRRSEAESRTPEFLQAHKRAEAAKQRSVLAAQRLGGAEKSASGGLYRPSSGLAGTKNAEDSPRGGLYSGTGKGAAGKSGVKGKGKGGFKKAGPIVSIMLAIFGFGGVMMGSQMFQPFSLVAQFQEKFNSMSVSTTTRSSYFVKWQMGDIANGNVKDPIKFNMFGRAKFNLSKKQISKLSAQGIDYDTDTKKMKFDTGEVEIDADGNTVKKVIEIDADSFDEMYTNDARFHQAYNAGSKTWRGKFANWFGSSVINFITTNKLTRNMFVDFRQRVDDSPGKSSMDVFKEIMSEKIAGTEGKLGVATADQNDNMDAKDEDGNSRPARNDEGEIYADRSDPVTHNPPEVVKANELKAKLDGIASKFSKGVNIACGILQVVGTISVLVAAAEAIQIINITTAAFETVDKVKAGYGDESPINDLANALNSRAANVTYEIKNDGGGSGIDNYYFSEGKGQEKTAMESAGVAALYSNGKVNANDPSVSSFNISKSLNGVIGGFVVAGTSFATCASAKLAAAAVKSGVSIGTTIACVAGAVGAAFTFGATLAACGPKLAEVGAKMALSVGAALLISGVVSLIVPFATKVATRNLVENLSGEDFGNALTSGANMYQGSAHRSSGGSLATADKYMAYLVDQQAVIADQAKYERESLSPFDMTSKYTFMGTLMTQLMSFTTSPNTLMGALRAGSSTVSSSLIAMTPTASAYNIAEILPGEDYDKTCPYLASINAVGDAFCNPYIMTDVSTMSTLPESVIKNVEGNLEDELTSEGNVVINKESDLAKYIVYCDARQSSFGVADYNIANTIGKFGQLNTGVSALNTVFNAAVGSTVIGDLTDIVSNSEQLDGMGYVTGESCVAGNSAGSLFGGSPSWNDKGEWYQRFIEDQALAESMGLIEESAVSAFLKEYYKENPLDNSYEGMLARYSGLTKEDVELALDIVWYADYIANYDPSERYAFGQEEEKADEPLNFDNEYVLASMMTATEEATYADLRSRSFAV